jgi:hypothetical protein
MNEAINDTNLFLILGGLHQLELRYSGHSVK